MPAGIPGAFNAAPVPGSAVRSERNAGLSGDDMKKAAPAEWAAFSGRVRSFVDAAGRPVRGRFARSGAPRLSLLCGGGRFNCARRILHEHVFVAAGSALPW
jgi:hypothetical protein